MSSAIKHFQYWSLNLIFFPFSHDQVPPYSRQNVMDPPLTFTWRGWIKALNQKYIQGGAILRNNSLWTNPIWQICKDFIFHTSILSMCFLSDFLGVWLQRCRNEKHGHRHYQLEHRGRKTPKLFCYWWKCRYVGLISQILKKNT